MAHQRSWFDVAAAQPARRIEAARRRLEPARARRALALLSDSNSAQLRHAARGARMNTQSLLPDGFPSAASISWRAPRRPPSAPAVRRAGRAVLLLRRRCRRRTAAAAAVAVCRRRRRPRPPPSPPPRAPSHAPPRAPPAGARPSPGPRGLIRRDRGVECAGRRRRYHAGEGGVHQRRRRRAREHGFFAGDAAAPEHRHHAASQRVSAMPTSFCAVHCSDLVEAPPRAGRGRAPRLR